MNQFYIKFLLTPLKGQSDFSHFKKSILLQMTPDILLSSTQVKRKLFCGNKCLVIRPELISTYVQKPPEDIT